MNKSRLTHRISRAALILVLALFSATTAWASVVTLDENTGEVTLQNGDVLTGTGGWNTHVKIADGATVTLSGVNITAYYNNLGHDWVGITCLGDAVIILAEGTTNDVAGGDSNPGIFVPSNKTLTLQGSGTLNATGGEDAAGIGNGFMSSCGNITISGGTVNANGGGAAAGIGSGYSESSCGTVTISGGIVNATGGEDAAGIGSGFISSCGNITITNGVIMVIATKGNYSPNTIGAGREGSCGTVTIGGVTGSITQSPYAYIPNLVTLTPQSGVMTLQNGAVLTGTGGTFTDVRIAAGATVVLFNVNITAIPDDYGYQWAGITCLGDAVIVLYQGTTSDVKGGFMYPGIYVPQGHTLTLQGSGTLNATGNSGAAGIGSGYHSSCGNIILSGGTVNATGGSYAAGIGSGFDSSCESITITNGVTMVIATKGSNSPNTIGAGSNSTCGSVTIGGIETGFITESPFTTYPYTVSFDANGGTGTMASMGFMYGVAQNLTANSFSSTSWGYSFDGWATSPNGEKVYDDGQSVSNLTQTPGATVTLYAKWITDISVNGDEYTIYTPTGWDIFCDSLANNSSGYFTGKIVKLGADISVTRMAGSSGHAFSGTFDGQGHTLTVSYQNNNGNVRTAPFSYVDGATIRNLVVAGDITGTASRAAGIVGETGSSLSHVTNCVSSVNISGGSYTGGISVGGKVEIIGCVFNGTIVGTNMSGGFVGYSNSALVISDCLFAPQEGSSIVGGTFYYNGGGEITPVNSYYTVLLGTEQGYPAVSDPDMTPMGTPMGTYPVSGLAAYANGLMYGDTFYHDPDFVLPFVQTDTDEYTIYTATGWHLFCDALQDNDTYNRFIGKTVKLDADISVTRMAGSSHHDFMGTFDGQGHTLTIAYGTSESPFSEEYAAPFRNVETGAVIHSLKVEGHIYTSNKYAAGIVGNQYGTVAVSDCRSSVVIHSSKNGDGTHGGIVANVHATITMSGCVYDGRMLTTNGTTLCGGLVGWSGSICTIRNCLYAPDTEVTMAPGETVIDDGATFLRYNSDGANTPANSYYTEPLGTVQGYPAVSDPAIQPSGDPTGSYPVSSLTAYANGLLCGDTFYGNPGATQTVALSSGWNWVSFNLEVTLNDLRAALMAALPDATNITIKSRTQNTAYNPGTNQWKGTLVSLDVTQMYMISVSSSCDITLEGTPVDPTEHPVTINNGTNWIAFPLNESMAISEAFAGFAVNGDKVKSRGNNTQYQGGSWRGQLTNLVPGQGYIYISASSEPRVLTFGPPPPPTGAIDGLFTINANGDQVYFSQGNLQYNASTNIWRFAEHQYDYIGSNNSNISSSYSGWIDLFGWGTSGYNHGAVCYQPWSTSVTPSDYYAYGSDTYNLFDQTGQADWGYNAISNGGNTENSGWRTLKRPEWGYVFNSRSTTSGIRYAKATVNGVSGIILLPDNWTASIYELYNTNGGNYDSNTITAEDWASVLEANGAVFLPAAGYRYGTSVINVGSCGYYWSASYHSSNKAYLMDFSYSLLNTYYDGSRYNCPSVRLVRVAEN